MKIVWYNMLYYKLVKDCNFCLYNILGGYYGLNKNVFKRLFINVLNIEKEIIFFR